MAARIEVVRFARFFLAITLFSVGSTRVLADPPNIVAQPAHLSVAVGSTARFTVAATGSDPLTFQWFKNNSPIPNATTSTLTIHNVQITDAAIYSVRISDPNGSTVSTGASLVVVSPNLFIKTQPVNQIAKLGAATVSFQVDVSSTAPPQFQWLKDGRALSGATNATLTLTQIRNEDAGAYSVIVYNLAGAIQSNPAILTVDAAVPPLIFEHPAPLEVRLGGTATFTVNASGQVPLSYQWLKNGTPLKQATNTVLVLAPVQATDAANYSVTVSNQLGRLTSFAARLTVQIPPSIRVHPVGRLAIAGANVTLSVTAAGTAPLRYQWIKDASPIAGATNATLSLTKLQLSQTGAYAVRVDNAFGTAISSNAVLTIGEAPSITRQPVGVTVFTGGNAEFSADATGTEPLDFQWLKNGVRLPNETNRVLRLHEVKSGDAGNYTFVATNQFAKATSLAGTLRVDPAVVIRKQPASIATPRGLTAEMSVAADGLPPLHFQWVKNGAPIPGATNALLLVPNVQASDAGSYNVVVTNRYGRVSSANALLRFEPSVLIQHQPQGQTNAPGVFTSLSVGALGLPPLSYQWYRDGNPITRGTNSELFLIPLQITDAGDYRVVVANQFGAATSTVATLTLAAPPGILRQPADAFAPVGSKVTLDPAVAGSPPLKLQWFRNSSLLAGATNLSLAFSNVVELDSAAYHFIVTNRFGATTSAVAHLNVGSPPTITLHPVSQRVDPNTSLTLSVQATGTAPLSFQWQKDNQPIPGAFLPFLQFRKFAPEEAGRYHVIVSNPYGTAASIEASLSVRSPPIIHTQPSNQQVTVGSSVQLSVHASGALPLTFQWFKNETQIQGAFSPNLTLPTVTLADAGLYRVRVANADGETISTAAILNVMPLSPIRGDLDGDRLPDLLFQHSNGSLGAWSMNIQEMHSAAFLQPNHPGDRWRAVDVADFDADGRQDLLLQHRNGSLGIWGMDGLHQRDVFALAVPFAPAEPWKAIAAADINQDHYPDILFQNSTGSLVVLFTNDTRPNGTARLNTTPIDPLWQAVGLGDFTGDTHLDLLFQHSDGTLAIWKLLGTFVGSAHMLEPQHPGDSNWRVVGAADRNADGLADLVFQHSTDGTLAIWIMNGTRLHEARFMEPSHPGADWQLIGP